MWVDQDQRELIIGGWTRWKIILVSWCVDDLNRTIYTTVYYDVPATKIVYSDNPDDVDHIDGLEFVPDVLNVLRRRMLLDDLANA